MFFGICYRASCSPLTSRIPSSGRSLHLELILRPRLTKLNSSVLSHAPSTSSFGRLGRLPSVISLPGWQCRIGYGPRTAWRSEGSLINRDVSCACAMTRRPGTSFLNAATLVEFGGMLPPGWVAPPFFSALGTAVPPCCSSGRPPLKRPPLARRGLRLRSRLSLGNYGKKEMPGFSTTGSQCRRF